jgi:hypothetical protein
MFRSGDTEHAFGLLTTLFDGSCKSETVERIFAAAGSYGNDPRPLRRAVPSQRAGIDFFCTVTKARRLCFMLK